MTSLLSPLKFASGGYDHRVHLWDLAHDLSGASAVELAIKHTSLIHSLLPIVDTSHKLVSVGADRDIPIYDLSAERVAHTLKVSCTPYHAHKTDSRSCTLFEVAHLETQFEIRDHRMPNQAAQRFGFLTEERRGRFEKADSWSHFVACGDRNGAVHLWDLRRASTEIALRQCFNDPVVQVVNTGPRLVACSKRNELACIDL
ncbi:WD repeat-containing protein 48 [Tylopilus felleus]